MLHLFPPCAPRPESNFDLEADPDQHPSLLSFNRPHSSKSTEHSSPPSYPGVRTPSFSGVLTMRPSFLTVNSAWERYIESAGRVYRGMEESVKRRLIELELGDEGEEKSRRKDPWLAQLDWR